MAQPTARNHAKRGTHNQYAQMTLPNPYRHVVLAAILIQSNLVLITAVRPVTTAGNPKHALKDMVVIDSGCSRHMIGNMTYLSDFEELNGGYVAFSGNPKGCKISGKEKAGEEIVQQYVLFPVWSFGSTNPQNTNGDAAFDKKEPEFEGRKPESEVNVSLSKFEDFSDNSINEDSAADTSQLPNDLNMPELEDITYSDDEDDVGAEADFNNLETSITYSIDTEKPLLKDPDGEDVDVHNYRSMIGSLMYVTSSRPDIMFAVCACTHFYETPKASHLHAVKRIFRYLKGKPHLGLWYPKDSPFDLVAYSDSDYAGASLDRKSTTRGCQFLGCRLISWQCKKQTVAMKKVNDVMRLQALVDKKKVIILEATIKDVLHLDDADGKGCSGVATLLFEGMIVPQEVPDEGDAEINVDDVHVVGVTVEGVVSAADDEVPTVITKLRSRVKKLERRNKASKLQRLKKVGTSQRIKTSDDTVMDDVPKQGRMINDMDADVDVTLKDVAVDVKDVAAQDAKIDESVDVQGRKAESQVQIYQIDLKHPDKVLSMQDDDVKLAKHQKVVEVVTTAKLITKVVTAASAIITAAALQLTTAVTLTLTTAPSAARRRKGVVIRDLIGLYY
uniref:Uncharacterized mitochondrial protein AtMg00810-like n=1 Tax=Tanacetum cinerariifolium TaxID=118510 RepID=A0A6L2J7I9_TANCI|nr:uncharacterized mitochondrial protein AtMg00810-like [Tanacetum cinerariifolium]